MPCTVRWDPSGCNNQRNECDALREHNHNPSCDDYLTRCELIARCVEPPPAGFDVASCRAQALKRTVCKAEACRADCVTRSTDPQNESLVGGVFAACAECCQAAQRADQDCVEKYDICLVPATRATDIDLCEENLEKCRDSASGRSKKMGCEYPFSGAPDPGSPSGSGGRTSPGAPPSGGGGSPGGAGGVIR